MSESVQTDVVKTYREVKTILISQPKPERSPYFDLEKKWGIRIDWRPFIHVEEVTEREFRRNRIRPDEFSAIIFTSKNAVDHFFRICDAMRCEMSQSTKYFCLTKAIADYLQKFIPRFFEMSCSQYFKIFISLCQQYPCSKKSTQER